MSARRNPKTNSARAYYRLAAKFDRAGNRRQAEHYRKVADRLTDEVRRDREHRAERVAAEAAWRAKQVKP
jgi:hypothetical protein